MKTQILTFESCADIGIVHIHENREVCSAQKLLAMFTLFIVQVQLVLFIGYKFEIYSI